MQRTHVPTSHHYITAEANMVSGYRQNPNRLKKPETKRTEPIHEVSDPAWVLCLLVDRVIVLHIVATMGFLGIVLCRTSSPYWGQYLRTGKQDAQDTKSVTEQPEIQKQWVQGITGFAAKKRQRLQLTTETLYNIRLKERDKRAYRNQLPLLTKQTQIGRASCRERVCLYV